MTTPKKPRELSDDMLWRQLRRHVNNERGRELVREAQGRHWVTNAELHINRAGTTKLVGQVARVSELMTELSERLGVSADEPRPELRLVGGDDAG